MVWLNSSVILNTIILFFLVNEVNSIINNDLLVWEDEHFIKKLTIEDIPEDCQQIGICSNITIYDTIFFNRILRRLLKRFKLKRFNVDQVMVPHLSLLEEIEELCASKEEIVWPQAAKDARGQWQYILNTNAIRYQAYRIHRCLDSGSSCSKAAIFKEFDSSCYQDIYLRKMVYIDVENKKLTTDYFQVPKCCSCKIIQND